MNFLSPIGFLYGMFMEVRNQLYDRGVVKSYSLGIRTISVGNLTTGGTGKTPLAALIAEILFERGENVCILTRGYGRDDPRKRVLVSDGKDILVNARIGGDEPVELAHKLKGRVVIVADADRVSAGLWAKKTFGITAFILDDGFQHRRVRRDLDIVCIDATDPWGNGRILPAGTLRESFNGLKRADAIVITRADQSDKVNDIRQRLLMRNGSVTVFEASSRIRSLVAIETFPAKTQSSHSENPADVFAFAGIGNPDSFITALKSSGIVVTGSCLFPDHHLYSRSDIERIESLAKQSGAEALVTTAKDAVKLEDQKFSIPCYVAVAETMINDLPSFRDLVVSS